jgi:hypothetical protein
MDGLENEDEGSKEAEAGGGASEMAQRFPDSSAERHHLSQQMDQSDQGRGTLRVSHAGHQAR